MGGLQNLEWLNKKMSYSIILFMNLFCIIIFLNDLNTQDIR